MSGRKSPPLPPSIRITTLPLLLNHPQSLTSAAAVRFLDLIKPFTPLLPEVSAPETKTPFNQKLVRHSSRAQRRRIWRLKSVDVDGPDALDIFGDEPGTLVMGDAEAKVLNSG